MSSEAPQLPKFADLNSSRALEIGMHKSAEVLRAMAASAVPYAEPEPLIDPTKQVCKCGNDDRKICGACSPIRSNAILTKAGRGDFHRYVRVVPEMNAQDTQNRQYKKNWAIAKRDLERALGRRISRREFQDIVNERAAKLKAENESTTIAMRAVPTREAE